MAEVPKTQSIAVLATLLVLCVGGGAAIGILTAGNIDTWYAQLNQPGWTPPNWLFGPVWWFKGGLCFGARGYDIQCPIFAGFTVGGGLQESL